MRKLHSKKSGIVLINILVFAFIAIVVMSALIGWAATLIKSSRQLAVREQAFAIAESGIDYYRWHLAHAPVDYKDGTSSSGPYVHDFADKDGNIIGQYSLYITPPPPGSTLVKIKSKGTVSSAPGVYRTIQVSLAIPSLAKYAVVANDTMRFGVGTEVFGPIHSNKGIRFDGLSHNVISSALATSTDTDFDKCTSTVWGVHTCISPADPVPPTLPQAHADVFLAGRQYPLPAVDFTGLTADLTQLKTQAVAAGRYLAASGSGFQGYHVVFSVANGVTTYNLYKVTALQAAPSGCSDSTNQWGTWSIKAPIASNQTLVSPANNPIPSNGIIFVEDHVWVDGQVNNARVTVAAGRIGNTDPTKDSNITINTNLRYTNYDGSDSIGLIAQGNVNAGLMSDDTMRIDGALVAQNGRVGRFYYSSSCSVSGTAYYNRASLTLYGMIATNARYGFAYIGGSGAGYATRSIIYDGNLLYGPPPFFPLSSDQYSTISWAEVK